MSKNANIISEHTTTVGVGDAVGVQSPKWYVAFVGHNTEKSCREKLQKLGYESYVASQEEVHEWKNGRKKKIERVVISTLLFVRVTEKQRHEIVNLPFIKYFLTDKARSTNDYGRHPLAVIPDSQMQQLRFMLFNAEEPVTFVTEHLRLGDHIRVARGSLKGLEGNVVRYKDGASYLVAQIESFGYAMIKIAIEDVEIINSGNNKQ
jgi:transcription antitermination factor NusG